jgi:hypothetical protein
MTDDGLPYPEFLLEHIANEWSGVNVPLIDPDVCLKVDSSLSYCGCVVPSTKLRQFVYLYQQSHDFDYETIAILTRIAQGSADNASIWDDLVSLEFQRDCGLSRDNYLAELLAVAERVEAEASLFEELLSA